LQALTKLLFEITVQTSTEIAEQEQFEIIKTEKSYLPYTKVGENLSKSETKIYSSNDVT